MKNKDDVNNMLFSKEELAALKDFTAKAVIEDRRIHGISNNNNNNNNQNQNISKKDKQEK